MRIARSPSPMLLCLVVSLAARAQTPALNGSDVAQSAATGKVPPNVILVKGAWSGATDSVTPVPEGGKVTAGTYDNPYFGLDLALPAGWIQKYEGPPPSDSGSYVLAQLRPADTVPRLNRGTLLIGAQDMFFTSTRATGALELINYTRDHLRADYRVERPPGAVTIAGRGFVQLGYVAPVAGLHWLVLATQIRCHVVEFIYTSANARLLESLMRNLNGMKLPPAEGASPSVSSDDTPVCVKGYANNENIIEKVDPVFAAQKYNAIPVRLIIDREGKVKHIHFISAFPAQAQAITTAVSQWRFKPYLRNGQPAEVETGILFGRAPRAAL
jgi:hypothetical protein